MRKWLVLVFIAVICLAGCAEHSYPAYDDVYYEVDEMPETSPDDEGIPFILEHQSWRIMLDGSIATLHRIVRSTDELHEFAETYFFSHSFNNSARVYISEIIDRFDDDFFEDRMLILSYATTGTGMQSLRFVRILLESEDTLNVRIGSNMPSWWTPDMDVTTDMGLNFFFVSLERNNEITAVYERWSSYAD